jgi:hypothetical protein
MAKRERDEAREERITMEIVVDAYNEDERALGWYSYLEDTLTFPFLARCRVKRAISPLHVGDEVEVIGMAPGEDCAAEMFVMMRWERDGLGVPLAQLDVLHADAATRQAVEDWHYWVDQGYEF